MKTTAKQSSPIRCSACGKKAAYCMAVAGSQGIGADGRKWAMLKMRYNCTSCFAEVRRGIRVVEAFRRDTRSVVMLAGGTDAR